jgi:hypothetical protein
MVVSFLAQMHGHTLKERARKTRKRGSFGSGVCRGWSLFFLGLAAWKKKERAGLRASCQLNPTEARKFRLQVNLTQAIHGGPA